MRVDFEILCSEFSSHVGDKVSSLRNIGVREKGNTRSPGDAVQIFASFGPLCVGASFLLFLRLRFPGRNTVHRLAFPHILISQFTPKYLLFTANYAATYCSNVNLVLSFSFQRTSIPYPSNGEIVKNRPNESRDPHQPRARGRRGADI